MINNNNFLKNVHACEKLGSVNYICTDKTGTLTRNKMHVVYIYNNFNEINVNDIDYEHKENYSNKFAKNYYQFFRDAIINNIDIELDKNGDIIIENSSKTDFAFYDLFKGFNENLKKKYQILDKIKFNSDRKKMSTIIKRNDGKFFIYIKGAPEVIFKACKYYLNQNGDVIEQIKQEDKIKLDNIIRKYSSLTLTNIVIAYKEITENDFITFCNSKQNANDLNYEIEKDNFVLIAIAAISDTLRPGVSRTLALCQGSNVNTIMITGDDTLIAESIAKNANIISSNINYLSITGQQFIERIGGIVCQTCTMNTAQCTCPKNLYQAKIKYGSNQKKEFLLSKIKKEKIHNIEEFKNIIKNLKIISRARAIDKYALVLGLQELDNTVAVIGDGVNDALALSKADVGFAIGNIGNDVVRDSADIIILNENFNSIFNNIKWGRNIFDNIRKFLLFQLSNNFSFVLFVFISVCIGDESPFTAIQILWINLIMDSLGSLALSTDDPSDELLYIKPYSKKENIINNNMWKVIISQSMIQFLLMLFIYLYAPFFIKEDNENRLEIIRQFKNCFGNFHAEISEFKNRKIYYYIMDGKKSSWGELKHIKINLDKKFCMFYDKNKFEKNQINNLYEAYKWYISTNGNTVHMTIIFNTFVFYSLFNQLNCRIINNNLNIFHKIFNNWFFCVVVIVEIILQFFIVQYGGLFFKCNIYGLTKSQWIWSIGLSLITFFINFLMKFSKFEKLCDVNWSKIFRLKREDENQFFLVDEDIPQTQRRQIEMEDY